MDACRDLIIYLTQVFYETEENDDNEDVINDLIGYFILLKIARQRQNISNEETEYDYSELSFRSNDTISTGSFTSDLDNYNSVLYTDSHRPIHFPV